jgi:hypothetical protein
MTSSRAISHSKRICEPVSRVQPSIRSGSSLRSGGASARRGATLLVSSPRLLLRLLLLPRYRGHRLQRTMTSSRGCQPCVHSLTVNGYANPSRESSHQFAPGPLCALEERLLVEGRVAVHHQVGERDCPRRRLAIARADAPPERREDPERIDGWTRETGSHIRLL